MGVFCVRCENDLYFCVDVVSVHCEWLLFLWVWFLMCALLDSGQLKCTIVCRSLGPHGQKLFYN